MQDPISWIIYELSKPEAILILLLAGACASAVVYLLMRRKNKKEGEHTNAEAPSAMPVVEQAQEPERMPLHGSESTLDGLLERIILEKVRAGEIDVVPEISLSRTGKLELLGEEWQGKVTMQIKKKKNAQQETLRKASAPEGGPSEAEAEKEGEDGGGGENEGENEDEKDMPTY